VLGLKNSRDLKTRGGVETMVAGDLECPSFVCVRVLSSAWGFICVPFRAGLFRFRSLSLSFGFSFVQLAFVTILFVLVLAGSVFVCLPLGSGWFRFRALQLDPCFVFILFRSVLVPLCFVPLACHFRSEGVRLCGFCFPAGQAACWPSFPRC
jgi:hypothetical protein